MHLANLTMSTVSVAVKCTVKTFKTHFSPMSKVLHCRTLVIFKKIQLQTCLRKMSKLKSSHDPSARENTIIHLTQMFSFPGKLWDTTEKPSSYEKCWF